MSETLGSFSWFNPSPDCIPVKTLWLLHCSLYLLDDLYHWFGGGQHGAVVLVPQTARAGVPVCAESIVLLAVLARLHEVQAQRVDAWVLGAGRGRTVLHFGAFDLVHGRRGLVLRLDGSRRRAHFWGGRVLLLGFGLGRWGVHIGGGRGGRGRSGRRFGHRRRRALHVAHFSVDTFDDVVVHEEVGDDAVFGRLQGRRRLEARSQL